MRNSTRVTLCVKTSGEKSLSASFSASEVINWNTHITVQWCKGSLEYDFLCEKVIFNRKMSAVHELTLKIKHNIQHRLTQKRGNKKRWKRKQLVSSLKWLICPLTNYLFRLTLKLPGCSHSVFPLHFFQCYNVLTVWSHNFSKKNRDHCKIYELNKCINLPDIYAIINHCSLGKKYANYCPLTENKL